MSQHLRRQIASLADEQLTHVRGVSSGVLERALINPINDVLSNVSTDVRDSLSQSSEIEGDAGLVGFKAFEEDRVAVCVLAGGMGSRLGTPKWDVRVPVIDVKARMLRSSMSAVSGGGRTFYPSVWYLTSQTFAADAQVEPEHMIIQDEWFTVNPMFDLMLEESGSPVMYPMGTGDALHKLFSDKTFLDWSSSPGERYLYTVAVDNVYAGPDIAMLGDHIQSSALSSWEVVERHGSDEDEPGVIWADGKLIAVRPNRLSCEINPKDLTHTVTHTGIINVDAALHWCAKTHTRYERRRAIVNGAVTLHLERDLHELTETMHSRFVVVPRELRYLPIRTPADVKMLKIHLASHQIIPSF